MTNHGEGTETRHNCLCLLQHIAFDIARGRLNKKEGRAYWLKQIGDALRDSGMSEHMVLQTLNATDFMERDNHD